MAKSQETSEWKITSMESVDPPFEVKYKTLLENARTEVSKKDAELFRVEEGEVPLIDLRRLILGGREREDCEREIAKASQEWGFFQVVGHGISGEILERMRSEQVKVLRKPFHEKVSGENLDYPAGNGNYVWGSLSPITAWNVSWSEAFHVRLADISSKGSSLTSLSSAIQEYTSVAFDLAQTLSDILAKNLGHNSNFFKENCLPSNSSLRMNRYPPRPISPNMFGFVAHTDSSFLTIVHQDDVGGLQLLKDGKWIAVKPHQEALIINIGDFFQAWSNDVYQSVRHRVVIDKAEEERFSIAYFFCPSDDAVIQSCVYRSFNYKQFRQQIIDDTKKVGTKIGLPGFLL